MAPKTRKTKRKSGGSALASNVKNLPQIIPEAPAFKKGTVQYSVGTPLNSQSVRIKIKRFDVNEKPITATSLETGSQER